MYEDCVDLINVGCVLMLTHTRKVTLENIQNNIKCVGLSEYLSYSRTIWFRDEN